MTLEDLKAKLAKDFDDAKVGGMDEEGLTALLESHASQIAEFTPEPEKNDFQKQREAHKRKIEELEAKFQADKEKAIADALEKQKSDKQKELEELKAKEEGRLGEVLEEYKTSLTNKEKELEDLKNELKQIRDDKISQKKQEIDALLKTLGEEKKAQFIEAFGEASLETQEKSLKFFISSIPKTTPDPLTPKDPSVTALSKKERYDELKFKSIQGKTSHDEDRELQALHENLL